MDFTERELEVVALVAEGYTDKSIADKLFLSTSAVKTRLRRIYTKLMDTNTDLDGRNHRVMLVRRAKNLEPISGGYGV